MKYKTEIKEEVVLHLETMTRHEREYPTEYIYKAHSYFSLPRYITVEVKRPIGSINEFLEVNDINEVEVLEFLMNKYK